MKPIRARLLALAALVGLALMLFQLNLATTQAIEGGPYILDRHAVGVGGGESTGGSYTLNSTTGQSSDEELSGGAYSLGGGFWGGGARAVALTTPTFTPTVTPTGTPTGTPTSFAISSPTPTATATIAGDATPTPTATPTAPEQGGGDQQLYLPLVKR
jgi:hypothetical protein